MSTDKSQPRLAATVAVVRDGAEGLEVLLLQRADKGDHNSLAWVFPGGLVDAADRQAQPYCVGLDEAQASAQLGLSGGGLDHHVAAIRETFEEAGLLFASDAQGRPVDLQGPDSARLAACRAALGRGELDLAGLCREFGLQLRAVSLHYIAHWLTPVGRAKRFDTRFFVGVLPAGQAAAPDAVETVQQVWLRPAQALAPENTRRLMTPTRAVLETLGAFPDTQALMAWARAPRTVQRVLPRLATGAAGPMPVLPEHAAWHELGRVDPLGRGEHSCEPQAGVAVALSPRVRRYTAAGMLTHSYLVDCGAAGWAVVDPGDNHAEALAAAAGGPLRWIALTDAAARNAPAVAALQALTGAQLLDASTGGADAPTAVLQPLRGASDGGLCFLMPAEGLLFSGGNEAPADLLRGQGGLWLAPRLGFLRPAAASPETAP